MQSLSLTQLTHACDRRLVWPPMSCTDVFSRHRNQIGGCTTSKNSGTDPSGLTNQLPGNGLTPVRVVSCRRLGWSQSSYNFLPALPVLSLAGVRVWRTSLYWSTWQRVHQIFVYVAWSFSCILVTLTVTHKFRRLWCLYPFVVIVTYLWFWIWMTTAQLYQTMSKSTTV